MIKISTLSLLFFGLSLMSVEAATPQKAKLSEIFANTQLKGKFSLTGSTIDGNINTARILSTKAALEVAHQFTPELQFNFDGGVTLEAGTYDRNAAAGDGPKPTNRLSLQESSLSFTPWDMINIEAGAINQKRFQSTLLLSSTPFLGAIQNLIIGTDTMSVTLFAEQAFASNKDLSSTLPDAGGNQVLPKFYTEGARINVDYQGFKLDLSAMHWAYNNLGSGIATESAVRGNTINGNLAGATGLKYRFIGISSAAKLEIPFVLGSKIKMGGEYLLNQKGPSGKNYGQLAKLALNFPVWNHSMELGGSYIKLMPDASAAFYSSYENNREIVELNTTWKSGVSALEVKFSAAHLEEIEANAYMSPENRMMLGLKTEMQFF